VRAAIFHPAAREAIHSFPESVRRELGKAIFDFAAGCGSGDASLPAYAFDCIRGRGAENSRP